MSLSIGKRVGNVSMGNEDEWNEPISGETDSEPIDGYYKTLESERGETKGSFFVPEDSKRS